MPMLNEQTIGLWDEISHMFLGHDQQAEVKARLDETGNHATLPKCRNCHDTEICLENGPKCAGTRRTAIK